MVRIGLVVATCLSVADPDSRRFGSPAFVVAQMLPLLAMAVISAVRGAFSYARPILRARLNETAPQWSSPSPTPISLRHWRIVTSAGTIVWLPELTAWARSIHDLLEPGGLFMIRDDHPVLGAMECEPWEISDDYLSGGGVRTYDDGSTYTDHIGAPIAHATNYEWRHDLGEVMNALLQAGLRIVDFAELPYMDWPAFPDLVPCRQGWTLAPGKPRIPLNFALVAQRCTEPDSRSR